LKPSERQASQLKLPLADATAAGHHDVAGDSTTAASRERSKTGTFGGLRWRRALALILLIAEFEPERWPRAAARWHARFVLEARGIGLDEAALALAAVRGLTGSHGELAAQTLRQLATAYGLSGVAIALGRR
jgi:hypothetical protein